MAQLKRNKATLDRILSRQRKDLWGKEYVPSQLATPEEAPSISKPTIIRPEKLGKRETHLLSDPEKKAGLLALYHPWVFDLHEQKMLSPRPRAHFLTGHPQCPGQIFPPLRGTMAHFKAVYGTRRSHPYIWVEDKTTGQESAKPWPYLGDLLLFIRAPSGHVFAVNWSVKLSERDFVEALSLDLPASKASKASAIKRHKIERLYYQDGDIITYQIAGNQIDDQVFFNLRWCSEDELEGGKVNPALRAEIYNRIGETVGNGVPAYKTFFKLSAQFNLTTREVIAVFCRGVWRRKIRVDLFEPILVDQPLIHERIDVLDHYSKWFEGEKCT